MMQDFAISGIFERLAQGYRVVAVDRPGFGHTNRPQSQSWTPAAQAKLVHKALVRLDIQQAIVVGHSWGTLVALSLALDYPTDVRSLVLLSGYYFPTFRADVLASLPSAAPIIGDLLSYAVAPLLGRAIRSRVFRKLFAPAAVPRRFQTEFPIELSLRPSQLKASAEDTVSMTPSAAALAKRYDELKMPIASWPGQEIGSLTSRVNLGAWTKSWHSPLWSLRRSRPYDPSQRSRKGGRRYQLGGQPRRNSQERPIAANAVADHCRRRPKTRGGNSGLNLWGSKVDVPAMRGPAPKEFVLLDQA